MDKNGYLMLGSPVANDFRSMKQPLVNLGFRYAVGAQGNVSQGIAVELQKPVYE